MPVTSPCHYRAHHRPTSGLDFVLDIKFPDPCQEIMDSLSFMNLEIFKFIPFACWFKADYFADLLFTTLGPIGISVGLLLTGLATKTKAKARAKMHYGAKVDTTSTTNGLISLFLLITFLALPSCSKKVFATFKCNDYTAVYEGEPETVERYLALDLSVSMVGRR